MNDGEVSFVHQRLEAGQGVVKADVVAGIEGDDVLMPGDHSDEA